MIKLIVVGGGQIGDSLQNIVVIRNACAIIVVRVGNNIHHRHARMTYAIIIGETMITLNGKLINPTIFPDNTSQVWKIDSPDLNDNVIIWRFENESEFLHLAQLKTLLDEYNCRTTLILPYLPYGRQDKDVTNETTFALHSFAKLLNTLNFNRIMINDPHSDVAVKLIRNSIAVYPISQVNSVISDTKADVIAYPDDGAVTRYSSIYKHPSIFGEKQRNQQTGRITNYKLIGNPDDKRVLIVDDICDGGATFVMLAKALYDAGAIEVNLFVSHGIFSKGLQVLRDAGIKRIFTMSGEV